MNSEYSQQAKKINLDFNVGFKKPGLFSGALVVIIALALYFVTPVWPVDFSSITRNMELSLQAHLRKIDLPNYNKQPAPEQRPAIVEQQQKERTIETWKNKKEKNEDIEALKRKVQELEKMLKKEKQVTYIPEQLNPSCNSDPTKISQSLPPPEKFFNNYKQLQPNTPDKKHLKGTTNAPLVKSSKHPSSRIIKRAEASLRTYKDLAIKRSKSYADEARERTVTDDFIKKEKHDPLSAVDPFLTNEFEKVRARFVAGGVIIPYTPTGPMWYSGLGEKSRGRNPCLRDIVNSYHSFMKINKEKLSSR